MVPYPPQLLRGYHSVTINRLFVKRKIKKVSNTGQDAYCMRSEASQSGIVQDSCQVLMQKRSPRCAAYKEKTGGAINLVAAFKSFNSLVRIFKLRSAFCSSASISLTSF